MNRNVLSELYASILVNAIYAMKNYPIMLIYSFFAPLSFLLVITIVSHGALLGVAIEGGLIMTMVQSGIGLQGDLSHFKNDLKVQDIVVSSPTSALTYITGMALSELIYSVPAIVILVVLAFIYIHTTVLSGIIVFMALLLIFMFSVSVGFMLSTFSRDIIENWAFSGILSTFLSTIPPVYYPITYIPQLFRYIAYLSPTTYAAGIIQNASGYLQLPGWLVVAEWGILLGASIVILIVTARKTRWRER